MSLHAQIQNNATGAENESSGNIMSVASNELCVQGNPAGLSLADSVACASVSSLRYPSLASMGRLNFCVYKPINKYNIALSVNRLGADYLNKHAVYLGLAHKINTVSLGIALSYQQWYAEGYVSKRTLQVDMGGSIILSKNLCLGTYITNITQSKWSRAPHDVLPTLMAIGLKYKLLKNVSLLAELEKYLHHKANFKIGMRYQINRLITLNTGVHGATHRIFAGLGVNSRKISIWCSYSYNYYLLSGIQLTLKYSFK